MRNLTKVIKILFSEVLKNITIEYKNHNNNIFSEEKLSEMVVFLMEDIQELLNGLQNSIKNNNYLISFGILRMLIERCVIVEILFEDKSTFIKHLSDYGEYFSLKVRDLLDSNGEMGSLKTKTRDEYKQKISRFQKKRCRDEICTEIETLWYADINSFKEKSLTRLANDHLVLLQIDNPKNPKIYNTLSGAIHGGIFIKKMTQESSDKKELNKLIYLATFTLVNGLSSKIEECFNIDGDKIGVNFLLNGFISKYN